jgi:polygalacturonase
MCVLTDKTHGTCCNSSWRCVYDAVFYEPICLPPTPWICAPSPPPCSVLRFGAVCDNRTDDTLAIQQTLDACNYSGTVSLPAGRTCLSFPLEMHNGTQLFLPARSRLKAFPDISRWPNSTHFNFVELRHKRDIAICGEGTIDGSGDAWWVHESATVRPRLFHMSNVHNISFRGVTLTMTGASTVRATPTLRAACPSLSLLASRLPLGGQ